MYKSFKKVFSIFVSMVTILWSVGAGALAFPISAQAATLNAGDLIKASGPSVYFYANDGKRYVFPNEKTYFSWFNDFSSVKTITDGELAAIPLGKNVTLRPGTKLVKITTDPKTYAVTKCGTLHWVESESVAKALFGDAWATRVVDVPDSFFENYTVGSSISTNVHPDGQLVTYTGDTNRYVVMNGQKRKIADDAAFNANHWNMVNSVVTTISYTNGSDVTGAEADNFWSVACTTGGVAQSGSVSVTLASDTPAGTTVPKNAMSVPMVKVTLSAGSADALVSGLRFHRVGVGATTDFANVYLYDQNGTRLTTGRSVNASSNMVEFNSLNVTIPANSMKSYYVYADFSTPTATGGNHAFELADAASVVLSGTGTVSGSFPVRGNVFVVGTASAGTISIAKGPTPANPNIGAKDAEISSFKLTAATNDISVKRVTLYQAGTADNADLTNFALYQGTTKVASAATVDTKGHITLNLDTPFLIANGVTRVFSLHADVAGRAARTIRTYVEYATDIYAVDSVYNSGAAVTITDYDGDTATTDYSEVTTQGGQLTFAFNGPVSSNIAKGRLATQLYKFSLTSPDNDLEIRNLRMNLTAITGQLCSAAACATPFFRNIKIVDLATGNTLVGPKELSTTASITTQDFVFNETFVVKAGETKDLALVADLANSTDANFIDMTYRGIFQAFAAGDVKVVSTGENLDLSKIVPNADTNGNVMTVKASSLTVALASTPISDTVVKKAANKPVVGLTLTAGSQSDVTVTNVILKCAANISATTWAYADCDQRVTSLAIFDGDTQVGLARTPDTTTGEAPISNMNLLIPKGTTKTLTVKATFASTASSTHSDKIAVGLTDSGATSITAQDEDSNTLTMTGGAIAQATYDTDASEQFSGVGGNGNPPVYQTIVNSGSITISADAHPASTIVVGNSTGDTWVPFARYKAHATYEDMTIDKVRVANVGGGDNANFQQVAIAMGGAVKGAATLSAGATGATDVDLTGNTITVPKGSDVNFEVWGKLSDVVSSSTAHGATTGVTRTGHAPYLGITTNVQSGQWDANYASKLNVRTTGASSGERVYFTSGALNANPMVIRKATPVVTRLPLSNTVFSKGQTQDLYRVQIGAKANGGNVSLKQMVFTVSKSASSTLANFRLQKGSVDMPTADYAIVDAEAGTNLKANTVDDLTSTLKVVVSFTNEESISGSGNIYSLRATVGSAVNTGNSVSVSMYQDPAAATVARAYLDVSDAISDTNAFAFVSNAAVWSLDTGAASGGVDGTNDKVGSFVWSDNSEENHSSATQTSFDWFSDYLVENLTESSALSN
ncbi:MAG: hypothetical protein WC766_02280 [Patescibacteria group bacterium]|jgi:hypothetical protein